MKFEPQPLTLSGGHVRLEPLRPDHAPALFAVCRHEAIWRWLPKPMPREVSEVEAWIAESLTLQAAGTEVPFVVVRATDGRVVGTTRYMDIRRIHRGLEIGWTWLTPEVQRTAVNTEAKYLLLCQAFENLGAVRVQLKTDERNERSRAAILRIGAAFEGILRQHLIRAHDGYIRNTAMYAITAAEWPAVRARLEKILGKTSPS